MDPISSILDDFEQLVKRRENSQQKSIFDRAVKFRPSKRRRIPFETTDFDVKFQHFNDVYNTKVFIDNFQRPALADPKLATYVTLEDVKDVVLFTSIYDIPADFLKLFLSDQVDRFLRALVLYMQHFLEVFRTVVKRREAVKATKLRHPISGCVETFWKESLSILRFIVAREYCQIVMATNDCAEFHHYDKKMKISHQSRELMLYRLLHVYSRRLVEVTLHEKDNAAVEEEMDRLFLVNAPTVDRKKKYGLEKLDIAILEHDFRVPRLQAQSVIFKEFYRPKRNPMLKKLGQQPWLSREVPSFFMAIEMALAGGESRFKDANIRLGILGFERLDFDCLLDIQLRVKTDNKSTTTSEAESAAAVIRVLVDKTVQLTGPSSVIPKREDSRDYNFDVNFLGHCENYNEQCMGIRKKRWIVFRKMNSRMNYEPPSQSKAMKLEIKPRGKINPLRQRESAASSSEKNQLPTFFFQTAYIPDSEDDLYAQFHEGFFNEVIESKRKIK